MSLFDTRNYYKPFDYEWAFEAYETMQKMHWLPSEVPLHEDVRDWNERLTEEEADDYQLEVSAIWVDQSSQLKRFRPAPHGRAHRIRKHFCHVTLQVTNKKALEIVQEVEQEAEVLEETE